MTSTVPVEVTQKSNNETTNFTSVKTLSESPDFNNSIPSSYTFDNENEIVTEPDKVNDPIPVIDYSLLVNGNHDQRTKTVHDLGKACEEWGFFMLINHFVPKSLMEKMVDQVFAFFNLREEEKQEYAGKEVVADSIKYGTSFNVSGDKNLFWRDFIKIIVHPQFHSPDKPSGFRY
ncbi:hypothetical protein TSUD_65760 [Trifolium subterraneum]|uniref:Non-haem dioxygenase N-terminal domain-containing protein n=1 Tax=Trifolium subterraneum TaxID=3900 RepID=A0A2Z6MCW2_TRISU|nr:hypothetical protein TSUD_65760 [Trifolium subterraneum]